MSSTLADDVRETTTAAYGTVPNLFEETTRYTGVPGAVYVAADAALMDGNLDPPEQQVVLLTLATYHNSRYDAVVHARLALDAGLSPDVIDALLAGESPPSDHMKALAEATRQSCEERGWLAPDTLRDFEERGVGRGKLYEIFAFIGLKTLTGFTSHLANPDLDAPLRAVEDRLERVPDEPDSVDRERLFLG